MSDSKKPRSNLREYRTLFPYLREYRRQYVAGFIFLVMVDVVQMLIPQCVRRGVDLVSSGDFTVSAMVKISLALTGLALLLSTGRFLWRYFIHGSARRIEAKLRANLFSRLLDLSYDFYQQNKIGDLMARLTNDIGVIRQAIGMGVVAFLDGTFMAASILVVMFMQDPGTAAFSVLPLLPITVLIAIFGSAIGKLFRRAQETYSAMSDSVQETFAGIRVIKSFVKEAWFIRKFADTNEDYKNANMALVKLFGFFFPFISFLSGLTTLILLLVGGRHVIEGTLSPGSLVALFSYLQMLIWPLMGAGFMVNMIQRGAASMGRVNEFMNAVPLIQNPPEAKTGDEAEAAVRFKNFSFGYRPERPVLSGLNFTIKKGTMVGILGKTGSGKSTLLKSMVRIIDPPPGAVLVEGLDVRDWDLAALRGRFGFTPQDSYLFSDSIRNNIAYGLPQDDAGNFLTPGAEALIQGAAELSLISRDLESFAAGWEALIGERGLTLSGGQKQRVSLSRAAILDPAILVLDDSLSAVDAETESLILKALLGARRGKTTILVSHRVSTLRHADRIIVLEEGRVTEDGAPAELLARGGFYARMAALQQLDSG